MRWWTIVLFGAALLVRLVLAPFPGIWGDTNLLVQYSRVVEQRGMLAVNDMEVSVLYPAGYLYHSFVVGRVLKNQLRDASNYHGQGDSGEISIVERVGVRTISIAYDLLIAAALLFALTLYGSPRAGRWAAAIYLFNPGVIISSAAWNYDSAPAFYQLVAVLFAALALQKGRTVFWLLAWVAAGFAFTMKAQAGMVVPILAVLTLCTRQIKLALMAPLAFFAVVALVFSPFLLGHEAGYLKRAYLDSFAAYPVTHIGAYNLWGFWFQRPISNRLLGLSYETIGRGLYLASMLWLSWCIWRQDVAQRIDALRRTAIVFTYAFGAPFILLTRMHERYFQPVVAVAILAGLLDPRLRGMMWGFSAGFAINMMQVFTQFLLIPYNLGSGPAAHFSYSVVRFFCCLLIVGMFLWLTWQLPRLLKPSEPALRSTESSTPSRAAVALATA